MGQWANSVDIVTDARHDIGRPSRETYPSLKAHMSGFYLRLPYPTLPRVRKPRDCKSCLKPSLTESSVLDAYGHLSIRHPHDPTRFFMARSVAPGIISSVDDLIEYYIEDAEPVNTSAAKRYSERCINSEIMKRFPDVNAVVHSYAPAVVAYTINGVPLRAVYQ